MLLILLLLRVLLVLRMLLVLSMLLLDLLLLLLGWANVPLSDLTITVGHGGNGGSSSLAVLVLQSLHSPGSGYAGVDSRQARVGGILITRMHGLRASAGFLLDSDRLRPDQPWLLLDGHPVGMRLVDIWQRERLS